RRGQRRARECARCHVASTPSFGDLAGTVSTLQERRDSHLRPAGCGVEWGDVGNKRQQTVGANPAIAIEVELDRIPEVLSENRAAASSPAVGALTLLAGAAR